MSAKITPLHFELKKLDRTMPVFTELPKYFTRDETRGRWPSTVQEMVSMLEQENTFCTTVWEDTRLIAAFFMAGNDDQGLDITVIAAAIDGTSIDSCTSDCGEKCDAEDFFPLILICLKADERGRNRIIRFHCEEFFPATEHWLAKYVGNPLMSFDWR